MYKKQSLAEYKYDKPKFLSTVVWYRAARWLIVKDHRTVPSYFFFYSVLAMINDG